MDDEKPHLSDEEIQQLQAFLKGLGAVQWLFKHSKFVALWVLAMIGAYTAIVQLFPNVTNGSGQ